MAKPMTYAELKAHLDTLSPSQLAREVIWWGEERGGKIGAVLVLPEDHVNVGHGMEPWSAYKDDPGRLIEDINDRLPAGTPVLIDCD